MSIYQAIEKLGLEYETHESDLYLKVTEESMIIMEAYAYKSTVDLFKSEIDGTMWFDIPFAYTPYFKRNRIVH